MESIHTCPVSHLRTSNDCRLRADSYNMLDPAVPFGGYKLSGWGKEGGPEALDSFLNTKAVWVSTE